MLKKSFLYGSIRSPSSEIFCRYCFDKTLERKYDEDIESYQEELIYPCVCKNAVHRECLNKWRETRSESQKDICEVCNTPYINIDNRCVKNKNIYFNYIIPKNFSCKEYIKGCAIILVLSIIGVLVDYSKIQNLKDMIVEYSIYICVIILFIIIPFIIYNIILFILNFVIYIRINIVKIIYSSCSCYE